MAPPAFDKHIRPVAIDLFAGAGGLSLGFEMAGFDVVAAVEYDPVHAATHLFNFPLAPVLCRDVRKVSGEDLKEAARAGWQRHHPGADAEEWDGIVDVLIGGPSCQGFSAIGRRVVDDDRNELITEFVRLVEEVRPTAFVMENVPGILAPQFDGILGDALDRLRAAGYALGDYGRPLDATQFGVPQRRRRVVVVGILGNVPPSQVVETVETPVVVSEALAGLPALSGRKQADGELLELDESQYFTYANTDNAYLETLRESGGAPSEPPRVLSGYLVTEHQESSVERFRDLPQGKTDPTSRTWRLVENSPARTLRAGTGRERGAFSAARPLHHTEPRVITIREAARLHSFPDWFRFHTTNWHGHRQIGNAVPPLLAKAVALSVAKSIGKDAAGPRFERPGQTSAKVNLLSMNLTQAAEYFKAASDEIPRARQRIAVSEVELRSSVGAI